MAAAAERKTRDEIRTNRKILERRTDIYNKILKRQRKREKKRINHLWIKN